MTEVHSYNLGVHAKVSFEMADSGYTGDVDMLGTLRLRLLDAIRTCGFVYQARCLSRTERSSRRHSRLEKTLFDPGSPYGVATMYGY